MPRTRSRPGALRAVLLTLALVATGLFMAASPAAAASTFRVQSTDFGKCIGIETTHNFAGDWTCTHNPDQTWHWGAGIAGSGFRQLINGNNKCLATSGGNDTEGTRLIAFTCLGTASPDQYWILGGGFLTNYKALNDPTTAADFVTVSGFSGANGAALVLGHAQPPEPGQEWQLLP